MKRSVPPLDIKSNINHAPHVVILGAGSSLAAFPNGDRNGFQLPLMNNLIDIVGLAQILERHAIDTDITNFEEFYDELAAGDKNQDLLQEIEQTIRNYFCKLELVDKATLYDYLLLSLREKDLIATFNWDPFLAKAYQRNVAIRKLPNIVFLHGNVEIGVCETHKRRGWASQICPQCNTQLRPSRLLFPVKQKNYSADPFIKNQWEILRSFLNHAYLVTIFGYSAPTTDIEAKNLMLSAWKDNPTRDLAQFNIVDIKNREELKHSWKDFSVRQYNGISDDFGIADNILNTDIFCHPRRTCEAFAMATLQQDPWRENPFPFVDGLHLLHSWITPLVQEEEAGMLTGNPCPMAFAP